MNTITHKLRKLNARLNPGHILFPPEWLVLGVNNVCNLHCKMCDVGTKSNTVFAENLTGTKPLNMPPELFKRIVDQSRKYFPKVKLGYAFTEPLVYPHLDETLAYAQKNKLRTAITTNALTLRQKARAISELGCNELFISLDGPEEIHNFIRGHPSTFQKAIEGIEEVLKYKQGPEISIFCVITEWNIGHLKRFVDFFRNYPITHIGLLHNNFTAPQTVVQHNAVFGEFYKATVSNTDESNVANIDLATLWQEITMIKKDKYPFGVSFSPELKSLHDLEVFYLKPGKFIGKTCGDVFSNIMIKSDGSVIPAHGRCYNLSIGNIYEQDLPAIWNSPVFSKFRTDLVAAGGLLPACSRCCSAFEK
jgi:Fe-coproporphyrin III synthase